MKGKGYKDVHILLEEGLFVPESLSPVKKNSIRKSVLITNDQYSSTLFARRNRYTQNELPPPDASPEEVNNFGMKRIGMPSIEELNEDRPQIEEDPPSKLSKGDLSDSHETSEVQNKDDSLPECQSAKHVMLEQDNGLTPLRSQTKANIPATKIASYTELESGNGRLSVESAPGVPEKERLSIQKGGKPLVFDFKFEAIQEEPFMPDEMDSPALKNIKRKIMEEAKISSLSPRSAFAKRTSMLNAEQINELMTNETTTNKIEQKPKIKLHRVEPRSQSSVSLKKESIKELVLPISSPIEPPTKTTPSSNLEVPQKLRHRPSLKLSKISQVNKKIVEIAEFAPNDVRTPEGLKNQSFGLKEPQPRQLAKEPRKIQTPQLQYGTRDELSFAFSRRESMDDIDSEFETDRSQEATLEEKEEDFVEFQKNQKNTGQFESSIKDPKFLEQFKKKIALRYPNIASLCLGLVCLDMILSEIYYFSDPVTKESNKTYHIFYFFVIIFLLILMIMRISTHHLDIFKGLIFGILMTRLLADFFELYLFLDDGIQHLK